MATTQLIDSLHPNSYQPQISPHKTKTCQDVIITVKFTVRLLEPRPPCFDESSVVKTTSHRKYGNVPRGEPAFEIQRYASSATYTINLLHSPFGVDFMNVLEGPSNGQELLLFFEEAVNLTRADGSAVLKRGDTVIMDNCGFHHGHFVEPILSALLANSGVRLLFQPPYSPEFNTCELCFHDIKEFLRRNQRLAEETAYTIYEACENITRVVNGREKNSRERARGDKEAVSKAQGTFSIFLHWVSASR